MNLFIQNDLSIHQTEFYTNNLKTLICRFDGLMVKGCSLVCYYLLLIEININGFKNVDLLVNNVFWGLHIVVCQSRLQVGVFIGPKSHRTGPNWTKDRIMGKARTEDRTNENWTGLGPNRKRTTYFYFYHFVDVIYYILCLIL